ncbi:MAG TPA: hypothetical protein VK968_08710, partial [Roseimicrobium sp.]|nr:hypothetical protein [Roseimicrobium sp.]
ISGRGNFDALKIPSLEGWRDFKVYPPTSSIGLTDPLGMEGRKSFEIVVVPQNAEVKELPEFAFSYFDPDQKSFRTEKHAATPLKIRASGQTQAQPTVIAATNAAPIQPIASDIVHIKPVLGSLQSPAPPLLASRWFIALQGLPLAAALGFWGWRRVQIRRASDPRRLRREASQRWLNEQLPQLDQLATTGNAPEFFALSVRALQEQLGAQFDMPSGSITESIIDTRVAPSGAAPELQEQLHRLFQTFNAARYAPTSSVQELSALSKQVRQVISDLQQLGGNVR